MSVPHLATACRLAGALSQLRTVLRMWPEPVSPSRQIVDVMLGSLLRSVQRLFFNVRPEFSDEFLARPSCHVIKQKIDAVREPEQLGNTQAFFSMQSWLRSWWRMQRYEVAANPPSPYSSSPFPPPRPSSPLQGNRTRVQRVVACETQSSFLPVTVPENCGVTRPVTQVSFRVEEFFLQALHSLVKFKASMSRTLRTAYR